MSKKAGDTKLFFHFLAAFHVKKNFFFSFSIQSSNVY